MRDYVCIVCARAIARRGARVRRWVPHPHEGCGAARRLGPIDARQGAPWFFRRSRGRGARDVIGWRQG